MHDAHDDLGLVCFHCTRFRGAMDNASAYGAEDWGFESPRKFKRFIFLLLVPKRQSLAPIFAAHFFRYFLSKRHAAAHCAPAVNWPSVRTARTQHSSPVSSVGRASDF